jgi:hypothetical protein
MKTILSLIAALFLLAGCKTCEPVVIDRWYDREVVRVQKDSVYFNSTDTIKEYQQGDTVFKYVTRWRVQYRERLTVDTLMVDSLIVKVVEKPVEVIRLRKDWIWWSGLIALMTLGIAIIIKTKEGLKL